MAQNNERLDVGANIARLRRAAGLTQSQLADMLYVSNKTVSKWERGAGYPEITQLTSLAKRLGTTVDNLLMGERYGIAIVGNMLTDVVKIIDKYPSMNMLANIKSITRAVGGAVPNTAIDLAVIDKNLSVSAIGLIGNDESGRYITGEMRRHGIDTSGVLLSDTTITGFSDVMSVETTGERTFFHHKGTNAEFAPKHVSLDTLGCRMLHIGYILLLDEFDKSDAEYGTVMAKFLKDAKDRGIKTSFDVVSDSGNRFAEKVIPALKYTDNAFMNEIEACGISGLSPRDDGGKLIVKNIKKTMEMILAAGVGERVIVHCPEAGFILSADGKFTVCPSLDLPKGYIKGTVGAGDAFCAGCLYGIYHGWSDLKILEFASGAAAANLSREDSVKGMKSKEEIISLVNDYDRQELNFTEDI